MISSRYISMEIIMQDLKNWLWSLGIVVGKESYLSVRFSNPTTNETRHRLPSRAGNLHGLNCFGHVIRELQTSTCQNIAKPWKQSSILSVDKKSKSTDSIHVLYWLVTFEQNNLTLNKHLFYMIKKTPSPQKNSLVTINISHWWTLHFIS